MSLTPNPQFFEVLHTGFGVSNSLPDACFSVGAKHRFFLLMVIPAPLSAEE